MKEVLDFISPYLKAEAILAAIIVFEGIYIWYLRHKNKLFSANIELVQKMTEIMTQLADKNVVKYEKVSSKRTFEFKNKTVILFEENNRLRNLFNEFLRTTLKGVALYSPDNAEHVLEEVKSHEPSLLIFSLSPATKMELLEQLSATRTPFPIMVITSFKIDKSELVKRTKIQSERLICLLKPFGLSEFLDQIVYLLKSRERDFR